MGWLMISSCDCPPKTHRTASSPSGSSWGPTPPSPRSLWCVVIVNPRNDEAFAYLHASRLHPPQLTPPNPPTPPPPTDLAKTHQHPPPTGGLLRPRGPLRARVLRRGRRPLRVRLGHGHGQELGARDALQLLHAGCVVWVNGVNGCVWSVQLLRAGCVRLSVPCRALRFLCV